VSAHSKATHIVFTSSFEAELNGVARGLKAQARVLNILEELRVSIASVSKLWSDNKKLWLILFMREYRKRSASYGTSDVIWCAREVQAR